MQTKYRNAQSQRGALTDLAHDARRIIASHRDNPSLRDTLIGALCSRFSAGMIANARRSSEAYADEVRDGVVVRSAAERN